MSATDISAGAPAPIAQPPDLAPARRAAFPWVTTLLIVLLLAIYVCEFWFNPGAGLTPSLDTLVTLGGLTRPLVLAGQWWRVFTAPLLHADPSHVLFNSLALLIIGIRLEPLIGACWFAGIFAVSALCGAVLSLLVNPPTIVGIGASGGIVGLFVSALFVAHRIADSKARLRLIRSAAGSLAPALLPFLSAASSGSTNIDYGAHFGGAIGGAACGLALLVLWPKALARPTQARWGAIAAAIFFLAAAGAIFPIAHSYGQWTQLMPRTIDTATLRAHAADLVAKYPHDPRARLAYGGTLADQGRYADAETQLRAGLMESDILREQYPPGLEAAIRAVLGVVLVEEHKADEAKSIVQPACAGIAAPDFPSAIKRVVDTDKLCP